MKTLIFILITSFSFAQDSWKPTLDKQAHFLAGYGVGLTVPLFAKKHVGLMTISVGVFVGAGKEIYDFYSPNGDPSIQDFTYTLTGTCFAVGTRYLAKNVRLKFNYRGYIKNFY